MIEVVISDIHARWKKFRDLLEKIGIIERGNTPDEDVRLPGFKIHQLGDAVNLGYGEIEADFYEYLLSILEPHDVKLIGNHEIPAFWPNDSMSFFGWMDHDKKAFDMVLEEWNAGRLQAASHVGEYLLTHAGLAPCFHREFRDMGLDAEGVAAFLNEEVKQVIEETDAWMQRSHRIVGADTCDGGIFWARLGWYDYETHHYSQIYGHTPKGPLQVNEKTWMIDTSTKDPVSPQYNLVRNRRPKRSECGSVAALVFDGDEPRLVTV